MKRGWTIVWILALGAVLGGCALWEQVPVLPPTQPPAELTASFGTSRDSIYLTWRGVEGATFYEVQRAATETGPYAPVGTSATPSFQDRVGRENEGKWFWYRVRACNAAGCGPWSGPVRGYAGRPPKPLGVQASDGTYPDIIRIEWEPVPGANVYQLYREPSPDPGCRGLCVVASNLKTNFYEDRNVRVGLRYTYAVRACNSYGCSELSERDSGCLEPCPVPLFAHEE